MLPTDGDPSAQGARRRSVASRPRDGAEAEGFRSRMQSTQVADDALLQTASRSYRKFVAVLPPSSSRSGGLQGVGRQLSKPPACTLHRTMTKVCKSDGEGTFAGTRGNGEGGPRAGISCFHQLTELSVAERDSDQLSTDRPHLQSDGSKYRISLSRRSRAEGLQSMAAARNDLVS